MHWEEKGEEELQDRTGGKLALHEESRVSRKCPTPFLASTRAESCGGLARTGSPSINSRVNPLLTCLMSHVALWESLPPASASILPGYHPAEVRSPPPTGFAEPHSNSSAWPRISRSLQVLREIHGGVPSTHRWVELVLEPTSCYSRFQLFLSFVFCNGKQHLGDNGAKWEDTGLKTGRLGGVPEKS